MQEIDQTMGDLATEGYAVTSTANAMFFINDPSHYLLGKQIRKLADSLWFKHVEAPTPEIPHPNADMVRLFIDAFTKRIAPARDFPDFQ
jgi:hypothetical protein